MIPKICGFGWKVYFSSFFIGILLFCGSTEAQPTLPSLTFSKERVNFSNSRSFYILDVIDKRNKKPNQLGEIIYYGQTKVLQTSQNLQRELYDHWTNSLRGREEDCLPLEVVLDEVSVAERKVAPNKVAGEIKVRVTFQWTRATTPLFLTNYSTSTTYTRPETNYDHEQIFRKMLDGAMRHFDQWIGLNEGKNPLLARKVVLAFVDTPYQDSQDTVFYKPIRKLTWNDFQGASTPARQQVRRGCIFEYVLRRKFENGG